MRPMALIGALIVIVGGLAWQIHVVHLDRSVAPGSWIAEARAEVYAVVKRQDGTLDTERDDISLMQLWYQDRINYRVEERLQRRGEQPTLFLSVRDGHRWWLYDGRRNSYSSFILEEPAPPEGVGDPSPLNFDLGFAAADDTEEFIEELRLRHRKDSVVRVVGESEMLGHKVTIIEYSGEYPADSTGPNGENAGAVAGGTGRVWLAAGPMFVLRSEYRRSDNTLISKAELTSLIFAAVPADRLTFTPPPGSREESPPRPTRP